MTKQQKLVLVVSILASLVAFLDMTIVNVTLPAISKSLGGGLLVQQWVVDGYLLTLGSLILVAGSLSDLFGRKRVLGAGLIGFAVTSLLCAIAPGSGTLILFRAMQGAAGALLVPSSLALIIAVFPENAQGKAIGTWTAWTGIATLIGPPLGGWLVDTASWRLAFGINVLPIVITLWLMRSLEGVNEPQRHAKVDFAGAGLCAAGLGSAVYALIEEPRRGWGSPLILWPLIAGALLMAAFVIYERRAANPILPLDFFKIRNFSVGNLATTAIYAGLSAAMFLITVFIQQVGRYSAFSAGIALLPVTALMFALSPRFGALAGRYGPRLFMAAGPIIAGFGFLLMLRVDPTVSYWTQLLPGVLVFGLGLSMTVSPLTAAVLGRIDPRHAGAASAVNNAVARIAGLLATAAIGVVSGSQITLIGFRHGLIWIAAVLIAGGVISGIGIENAPRGGPAPDKS